ncbi:MAG: hypothetical protein Q7S57_03275 [bacterium]|nr:hypothetical protein [bacterium]
MARKNKSEQNLQNFLTVKVLSATQVMFDDQAWSVASSNKLGPFSIVPGHAGFIALIDDTLEISRTEHDKVKIEIPIKKAVLHCQNNNVRILVGSV